MSDYLVTLTKYIQKKYPEGKYLYKSCSTLNDSWMVVLQLTEDSITNQLRLSSDCPNRKFAKFRASELKVIDITNKFDQTKTIDSIESSVYTKSKIKYVREKIVKSNLFDSDLSEVCTNGIHFFESIEAAFYCELNGLHNYTGNYFSWHKNGQKNHEGNYLNGKKSGNWIHWHETGQKKEEGNYLEGKRTGCWVNWYETGQKRFECDYLGGIQSGHWICFDIDGKTKGEGNYTSGDKNGSWTYWHLKTRL